MAHYRLLDRLPSAIVTAGGSEKKVYEGNTVYLNKGDNFELRFFNPLREKIGVEIIFNGQKKSDGLLVVNPGEDIILDRFLDDKKKMSFDTYYINADNPSAVAAAELNGDVIVNFYKEKFARNIYYSQQFYSTGTSGASGTDGTSGSSGTQGTTINIHNSFSPPGIFASESDLTETSANVNYSDEYLSFDEQNITLDSLNLNKSLEETGRVEKGDESNQNLNLVDIEFESRAFHSVHYNLKPTSTKGYTRATEIRNYCPECGYRIRKETWKFCPKCGEKLM
ncbi:MAG: zinc ribbon domain-containing protein [Candidatus Izemoplasmatales bacterium]|nr:zinc ribbon domain-containing protein [Candidatus Izemoplasmatales bacterium]